MGEDNDDREGVTDDSAAEIRYLCALRRLD